ncbi:MAG: peptidylprolyl isomerase [Oscillospiraceae bacterium]|nr:peptidylprolyl isomerase [Oscillospiraceae bacterium]
MLSSFTVTGCGIFTRQSNAITEYDYSVMRLVQLEELYENQPIAVIHTEFGIIKIALYPQYAPKTVENFINLINAGFYDGKKIEGVPMNALFYSGTPNKDDEFVGAVVEKEFSVNLWPFKGALCARSDVQGAEGESDSRFLIVNGEPFEDEHVEQLRTVTRNGEQLLPDELLLALQEKGCMVTLSGFYTVFGQTFEGFDVIEAICNAPADRNGVPIDEIIIEKIEIEYYTGGE